MRLVPLFLQLKEIDGQTHVDVNANLIRSISWNAHEKRTYLDVGSEEPIRVLDTPGDIKSKLEEIRMDEVRNARSARPAL